MAFDPVPNPKRTSPRTPKTLDDLVQARIDGRLSRRSMVEKALKLGIAAPVVSVMLHATGDMAFGAPTQRPEAALTLPQATSVKADQPTKPAGEPKQGGTVTCGTNEEPDTLHPWLTQLVTGTDVVVGIMESLMPYDSAEKFIPGLATEVSIGQDGKHYTFTLRDGGKFHNGDDFGADDVIVAWKTITNPDFGAFNLSGWDKIADITADGNKLTMTTTEVYAPFMSYVAPTSIIPKSVIPQPAPAAAAASPAAGATPAASTAFDDFKQTFGRSPIGTGPFKFKEWQAKQQIVLERFDGYWGTKPKLDQVIYRVVPDDNTQLVQLKTGEIQLCSSAGNIPVTRVDEVLAFPNITVLEFSSQAWNHIDLKQMDFLRMTKVRQALDFATPSAQIIDKLLKGRALPSIADQAPGTWAFDASIQPRPYDLDQAKKLLAEAGLTAGADGTLEGKVPTTDGNVGDGEVKPFNLQLWYVSGSADTERIVQVIAQSWNQLGIKTEPKSQDVSTIWGPEGYQWTKDMTGCLYSWFNGNDPTDTFYWNSSQIPASPTGSGGNAIAYFHHFTFQDKIDELTNKGDNVVDQAERTKIYAEIQALLHEEVPVIFISWAKSFSAAASNIGGYWPSAYTNLLWNVQEWYLT